MFAAFPLALFLIGAISLVALPVGGTSATVIGAQSLAPTIRNRPPVEMDKKYVFATALRSTNA
jgi:hypothetical protein